MEMNEQSSADHISKPPDISSPTDFYGLFDSPDKPTGHSEELQVRSTTFTSPSELTCD